ncbi:bifunctional UDP-N-acetylglucosamine diphosphorylase/glucosamine-1-phosphate N-acetyltransferase GlmU [Limimonas halophila]|nr:bifunctional UDP-N-acetylglucosamine diphosphorylase/glucosamine-1-phosphate N-acetyltransferase GlmU [Limimonas halophila]
MTRPRRAVVVLAAGEGTRMRSARPKVLHPVAGRPMLNHVLDAVGELEPEKVVVVVGPDMHSVAEAAAPHPVVEQTERLGTAHAVEAARPALGDMADDPKAEVLVVYGDTPLVTGDTLERLSRARSDSEAGLAILGFRTGEPGHYGRLIQNEDGTVRRIVEARDATAEQLEIGLCNAGTLCARAPLLQQLLSQVGNHNASGEFQLTDVFGLATEAGETTALAEADLETVQGVNSRAELAQAEAAMQRRLRQLAMRGGASLVAPETVFLSHDTELGADVLVEPHVVFGPGVAVDDGATIRAFSHLEGAHVRPDASVGPYARLRPGTDVGEGAAIGNFVETKAVTLGEGAKANHLTYLGDAEVGAGANVGAGTITCNYDGIAKHRTQIGANAFIGSNTALVAPVSVGENAIVGAGSTITLDVDADAVAVARGKQHNRAGAASRFRAARRESERG